MRRFAPLFALALALASCKDKPSARPEAIAPDPSSSAKAVDSIVIAPKMPAVGTRYQETRKSHMTLAVKIDIGAARNKSTIDDSETTVERSEVLAVEGKVVTKKKLTYVEKKKLQSENGKEKVGATPVAGKTYVLALVAGKPTVTDEAGKPVPAEEEEVVLKSHKSFGKPDPVFEGFPTTPIHVGDDLPSLKKALQENLEGAEDGKDHPEFVVQTVKLTGLEKGAEPVAVFSLSILVQTPDSSAEPFAMKAELTGTMKIRTKDAWLVGMELKGPLALTGRDPSFKVEGSGDMTMQFENVY